MCKVFPTVDSIQRIGYTAERKDKVTWIFVTASCTPRADISNCKKQLPHLGLGEQKESSGVTRTWELGGEVLRWLVHGPLVEALHTAPAQTPKKAWLVGAGASVEAWYGDAGKAERSWRLEVWGEWGLLMEAGNQRSLVPPSNLPSEPPIDRTSREGNQLGSLGKTVCRVPALVSQSRVKKGQLRASLVAQWLRICLLMQGTQVRALVWEDPTCHGAAGPVSHNY